MGRLKQALSEAFSGGRAVPRGSLGVLLDEARRLAGGSRRAAAAATGIPESSMRRWQKGVTPKNPASVLRRLETGIRRMMRPADPAGGKVTVRVTAGKPPTRVVPVSPDAIRRAGEAWERGDLGGMVRAFRGGISDDWYRDELFKPDADDESYDDDDGRYDGIIGDDEGSAPLVGAVSW